jgi:hypothetical protein
MNEKRMRNTALGVKGGPPQMYKSYTYNMCEVIGLISMKTENYKYHTFLL